jgi:D-3-phosphoglycerate dehydrogenase
VVKSSFLQPYKSIDLKQMDSKLSVLIVDDVHSGLMERFDELSIQYSYQPDIHSNEIANVIKDYTALVVRSKIRIDKSLLQANKQLVLIARAGSGMDNIDLEYAGICNVTCMNTPEANADAVAEQTVGMLLALNHNLVKSNRQVVNGVWQREDNRGIELSNCTVGIIGYGNTGSAFASKLAGFGCKIMAYDKYKHGFGSELVEETELEDLMAHSDVISFHIPLTQETKNWIGAAWIDELTKNITLLNLSRGGIMKTADVIEAIKLKKIKAFATDVLENEILESFNTKQRQEFQWLNDQDNVLITPHIGGWTKESYIKISNVLANKIEGWLKSDTNAVNTTT